MRDWHEWYREYDDPTSSQSRRLEVVREHLRKALGANPDARLLSLCSGDGRDTLPVLEDFPRVWATLVELDADLASRARIRANSGTDVRTADAGMTASFLDVAPVDLLLACGLFGNINDADVERTINALPSLLAPGATVIWTRGDRKPDDPSDIEGDPSEWVRGLFAERGFTERSFTRPDDARFRVGVAQWQRPTVTNAALPEHLFTLH